MINLLRKIGGIAILTLLLAGILSEPAYTQDDVNFDWKQYVFFSKWGPDVSFQYSIFLKDSVRAKFGSSYIKGYMDGVNKDNFYREVNDEMIKSINWYLKGYLDGKNDAWIYFSYNPLAYFSLNGNFFGLYDYALPFRSVLGWVKSLYYSQFGFGFFIASTSFPYIPKSDFQDYQQFYNYKKFSHSLSVDSKELKKIEESNPKKIKKTISRVENIEMITPVKSGTIIDKITTHNKTRQNALRIKNSINNSVLQRATENWPDLKRYVQEKGFDNISVIDTRSTERTKLDRENTLIEIAIPGRQFNRNFTQRISKRYNINLDEFESTRRHRGIFSVENEEWGRTNIRTSSGTISSSNGVSVDRGTQSRNKGIERN